MDSLIYLDKTWHSSQHFLATRAFPQANNRQVTLATRALQAANSSQVGRLASRAFPQASQADSALPLSAISQTGNAQPSLVDSTPSQAESVVSHSGNSPVSLADSTLTQAESSISQAGNTHSSQAGSSQASPGDGTLSQAESEISQAGSSQASPEDSTLPQAKSAVLPQVVRCSARLRASKDSNNSQSGNTPNNSSRQAGNTLSVDSVISQPDSNVPQMASSQAGASQEARSSPPNRHNSPQGSSPLEEPNPKWVINLSSKPLTKAQRSVLAKGPNFAVSQKHPPNLEYITAIEAACTKLSQQDAEELRADVNWVLRASHPQT